MDKMVGTTFSSTSCLSYILTHSDAQWKEEMYERLLMKSIQYAVDMYLRGSGPYWKSGADLQWCVFAHVGCMARSARMACLVSWLGLLWLSFCAWHALATVGYLLYFFCDSSGAGSLMWMKTPVICIGLKFVQQLILYAYPSKLVSGITTNISITSFCI